MPNRVGGLLGAILVFCIQIAVQGQMNFVDDGTQVSVVDNNKLVLSYRYGAEGPDTRDSHFIFPMTGLSGEALLAESGASDGHSGIFWAWRNCRAGGRPMDVWAGTSARRVFERWTMQAAKADRVELGLQNVWILDGSEEAQVLETVHITVLPATRKGRSIDVSLYLRNITYGVVEIGGVDGIQGFCIRLASDLKNLTLSGGQGVVGEGDTSIMSPWLDISYRDARHSSYSGLAIFQHPKNPGFSGRNWFIEPDGLVGAGIAGSQRFELRPGEGLHFRYRLYIHDGFGPNQALDQIYGRYLADLAQESAG